MATLIAPAANIKLYDYETKTVDLSRLRADSTTLGRALDNAVENAIAKVKAAFSAQPSAFVRGMVGAIERGEAGADYVWVRFTNDENELVSEMYVNCLFLPTEGRGCVQVAGKEYWFDGPVLQAVLERFMEANNETYHLDLDEIYQAALRS